MKSRFLFLNAWLLVLLSVNAIAAPSKKADDLEDELSKLKLPSNVAPVTVKDEKLYAIQTRYSPLTHRSEVTAAGGFNLTSNSFLLSTQAELGYRFHFTDRWSLGLNGAMAFNMLSDAGDRIIEEEGRVPDLAYVKYRADMLMGFNVFYGKFRLSMNNVFYFDQYVALGPGVVVTNNGTSVAGVADIGFVFWAGKSGSVRIGVKDYLFNEKRELSEGIVNHLLIHLDLGYLFGGGDGT